MLSRAVMLLASLMGAFAVAVLVGRSALAQQPTWSDFPNGPSSRLFTPRSGALYVVGDDPSPGAPNGTLLRSNDGGLTWGAIGQATETGEILAYTVDSANHDVIYAASERGTYKSVDGGQSWSLIDSPAVPHGSLVSVLTVSAADPNIVYAAIHPNLGGSANEWWVRRSDDAGATWKEIEAAPASDAKYRFHALFYPLPGDADRALRAMGSGGGADSFHELELTSDRGMTWRKPTLLGARGDRFYNPQWASTGPDGTIYLSGNRDYRAPGLVVMTSSDLGETWTTRMTSQTSNPNRDVEATWETVHDIAADPTHAGRAYAAFTKFLRQAGQGGGTAVGAVLRMTDDGGATWTDLSTDDAGGILALAVGIDSHYLFAGTTTGVVRMQAP